MEWGLAGSECCVTEARSIVSDTAAGSLRLEDLLLTYLIAAGTCV